MHKQSKADFSYTLDTYQGHPVIYIIDENRGNMSVTNDIERVIADIVSHEHIDPAFHYILYRDSEGYWNGYDVMIDDFVPLREKDSLDAINKYINGP